MNDKTRADMVKHIVLNPEDADKFIRPRMIPAMKTSYDGTPMLKLSIDQTGLYRVYYDDIVAEAGIDLASYDPQMIKIYNKGVQIPLFISDISDNVFNAGDYIEFYCERLHGDGCYYDRYSLENKYILTTGGSAGARYLQYSSSISPDIDVDNFIRSSTATVHIENDLITKNFVNSSADSSDMWYMEMFIAPDTFEYAVPLTFADTLSGYVDFSMLLHGYSAPGYVNPDHPTDLYLNDSFITRMDWDDQIPYLFTDDSIWIGSSDTLNIDMFVQLVNDSSNSILLNWFEVNYRKLLSTDDGAVYFTIDDSISNGRCRFNLSGFNTNNIVIYRNKVKKVISPEVTADSVTGKYNVVFEDDVHSTDRTYAVVEISEIMQPLSIEPFINAGLASPTNRGDYVIIVDQGLKPYGTMLAGALSEDREIIVAGTEEIYNEYNYGIRSIDAIKDFISNAYNSWSLPPTHVLLLGDGSKDNNNHRGLWDYYIPVPYFFDEFWGLASSDNYYARIVGDDPVEDISIARYPAKNEGDILNLIRKVNHYDDPRNVGTHFLRAMMVYDTMDYSSSEPDTREIAGVLPEYLYPEFFSTHYEWNTDMILEFEKGAFIVNALAHGATTSIAYGMFLRIDDIYRMQNINRLPLVTVFSCITAEYDQPNPDSMSIGEAFVTAPNGGAIAYYGAAETSYPGRNKQLSKSLFEQFSYWNLRNIGDIIHMGELLFYINNSDSISYITPQAYQIMNYNLLGINMVDLKIPLESSVIPSISPSSLSPNDTVAITVKDNGMSDGNLETVIIDSNKNALSHDHSEMFAGFGINELIIPDTVEAGMLTVLTVSSDTDSSALYISYPSVEDIGLNGFWMDPQSPDTNETFRIYARMDNQDKLDHMEAVAITKNDLTSVSLPNKTLIRDAADTTLFYTDLYNPLPAEMKDYRFIYKIFIVDTSGNTYTTSSKLYLVRAMPDLYSEDLISIKSVNRKPYLYTNIGNISGRQVNNLFVKYTAQGEADTLESADTLSIIDYNLIESGFYAKKDMLDWKIVIEVDPDQLVFDRNRDNNISYVDSFNYQIVFYSDTMSVDYQYRKMNYKSEYTTSHHGSFIAVTRNDYEAVQEGIVPFKYADEPNAYEYKMINGDTAAINNVKIRFTGADNEIFRVLKFDEQFGVFITQEMKADTALISLDPGENRLLYAACDDSVSPNIDIIIQNREYTNGVILNNDVEIGCLIEDDNGVNAEKLLCILDEDTLDASEISFERTDECTSLPVRIRKSLEDGEYTLKVIAQDIYSNESSKSITFKVSEQFKIINAVRSTNTVLACQLTDDATALDLYIYTSYGKLIETHNLGASSGLVSMDYDVSHLPNGTYFYYFSAQNAEGETTKSLTQKMSILR